MTDRGPAVEAAREYVKRVDLIRERYTDGRPAPNETYDFATALLAAQARIAQLEGDVATIIALKNKALWERDELNRECQRMVNACNLEQDLKEQIEAAQAALAEIAQLWDADSPEVDLATAAHIARKALGREP